MTPLSLVEALAPGKWPVFALVSARVVGLLLVAPLWSLSAVPRSVRGAVAVVLTLALLPATPRPAAEDESLLVLPIAAELLVGLTVGLTAGVLMHGVALAGEIASIQMALNLGPVFTPMMEGTSSGVGELKSYLALAIYVGLGGHLILAGGLAESLRLIPPGGPYQIDEGARAALVLCGTVFSTAVRVAAPVMVALFLANVALAVLSRAVPQLNAMAVAFPVTIGLGLLVLGASLPILGGAVGTWVPELEGRVAGLLRAFSAAPVR